MLEILTGALEMLKIQAGAEEMLRKTIQNRPWRRLGGVPGASWKPCASWEIKKTFGSSVWEASWGGSGGSLGLS